MANTPTKASKEAIENAQAGWDRFVYGSNIGIYAVIAILAIMAVTLV